MNKQQCKSCQYFLQHYTFDNRKSFRVLRALHIFQTKTKAAEFCRLRKFYPCTLQEDAFVFKEYLSKELLQYVLSLELLPEIGDQES